MRDMQISEKEEKILDLFTTEVCQLMGKYFEMGLSEDWTRGSLMSAIVASLTCTHGTSRGVLLKEVGEYFERSYEAAVEVIEEEFWG